MTLDWLEDTDVEVTRAGTIGGGLSWLALAAEEQPKDGTIEFVASTPTVDRMGDSIDQQTWKLANFRRNPVFLADHNGREVVGRVPKAGRTATEAGDQQLRIRVLFDESPLNPKGMLLAHQHRNGFRSAVSVGFIPGETQNRTDLPSDHPLHIDPKTMSRWMAGSLFRHSELLEVSSVSVPANPQAIQLAADLADAENLDAAVTRALNETLPAKLRDLILDLIKKDAEIRRSVVSLFMATPNPTRGGLDHLWSK